MAFILIRALKALSLYRLMPHTHIDPFTHIYPFTHRQRRLPCREPTGTSGVLNVRNIKKLVNII